jgi:hypothetical protein
MKKELIDFEKYLNQDVKVFSKGKSDPVTGRITNIRKKFIVLLAKKANRQERKIVYRTKSVKIEDIEKVTII